MRLVWLLVIGLVLAFRCALAQEPTDCAAIRSKLDPATGVFKSEKCVTYSELPSSVLKEARLRTIGALGASGRKHLPYVLELLKDEDWDVRTAAAEALGLIGDDETAPYLVAVISPRDWRLTFQAMLSLAKLNTPQANGILADVANTYWLPAIAEAAHDLTKEHGAAPSLTKSSAEETLMNFCEASTDQASLPRCANVADERDIERYNWEVEKYRIRMGLAFLNHPALKGATPLGATLKVDGGEFIGTDHGEWGGDLVFAHGSTRQSILKENILAVAKRGDDILVITGLTHLDSRLGYIFGLSRQKDGTWIAQRRWRLPGAPRNIVMTPDGTIGLHGIFGSVLYRPDDTLQWLACGQSYSCRP